MNDETKSIFVYDKRAMFILLCALSVFLLFVKKSFIENETAAFEFLADKGQAGILQLISALQMFSIPVIYLWKFTVIGFVIWVGCFMFGFRVTYSQCWSVALVSEFVFLIPETVKIAWFLFVETDPRLYDVRAFYPISLMNFFDYYTLDTRYSYPLRALNVWEILYWFVLVAGLHYFTRREKKYAWIIVAGSYIPIFLLWLWFYIIVYK
jgi:hypothetical protein